MHKKIRNRINVLRIFIKTVVGGKKLLLHRLQRGHAAIDHAVELMIDIDAQDIWFVFAWLFERIELASQ